jgi:hypothetical protein
MAEYFVVTNSFAAPFFSDTDTQFVEAESAEAALLKVAATYKHPAGLYAADAYGNANEFHHNTEPMARWLCNHEIEKRSITASMNGYSYLGHAPGSFDINGQRHDIPNPKEGRIWTFTKR